MRIRRCAIVFIEPREGLEFDLAEILAGATGLIRRTRWLALAPHVGREIEIDLAACELLGRLSPQQWIDAEALEQGGERALSSLLDAGLVISDAPDNAGWRARDDALRAVHWHPLAATLHAFTRWSGVDAVQNMKATGTETALKMRENLGAPPPDVISTAGREAWQCLPRSAPTDFDRLLARRVTCRNFDATRALPQALFAQVLERVFAARAQMRVTGDTVFLKKSVPSGGGLHPMECYLIVQHVEGVPRGLYHYQAAEHALEPLPSPDGAEWTADSLRGFVMEVVAQQHWFQDAHVLVMLAPRFDRTFWKYRHHAKGYRVIALEGGHLSQTLYLAATDAGLGAFITGAINEQTLERAFGLDPIDQGALAICGFGWRAREMVTAELDPNGEIWTVAGDAAAG